MATGKKFYWIKLRKDFMTSDIVDFLMGQRDGSQYVVLYQMLCLMCINTNGELSRQIGEVIIPFDVDKIQRDCKYFNRDTIVIALGLFKKLGLIYEHEKGCLVISDFENLIGSETDYAKQKRTIRKNKEISGHLQDNVCSDVTKKQDSDVDNVHSIVSEMSTQRKSIEKEYRDKSKDIREESLEEDVFTVSKETVHQTDVRCIMDAWNGLQQYGIKAVSKISNSSKRYRSLVARIKEYGISDILQAIEKIKQSDFLQGKNKNGWTITFDWFVMPSNFPKVLEGNYDNSGTGQSKSQNSQLDYLLNSIMEDETNDQDRK